MCCVMSKSAYRSTVPAVAALVVYLSWGVHLLAVVCAMAVAEWAIAWALLLIRFWHHR